MKECNQTFIKTCMCNSVKVHSFESMGTYDGPGLRLVVFLQGCNFRCAYCANPDTISIVEGGKDTPIEEIVRMAVSQKPFFGKRGGVTFSGGEPTLQAGKLLPLFKRLKEEGIHICVDSNGSIFNDDVRDLLSMTDIVLLDVKEFNDVRHQDLTERSNRQTLATAEWLELNGKPFWLRYVLVPGVTSFSEDIIALCEHFKSYKMLQRIEILPYHTLGKHKYEYLNMPYRLEGIKENTPEQIQEAAEIFRRYFSCVYVN